MYHDFKIFNRQNDDKNSTQDSMKTQKQELNAITVIQKPVLKKIFEITRQT